MEYDYIVHCYEKKFFIMAVDPLQPEGYSFTKPPLTLTKNLEWKGLVKNEDLMLFDSRDEAWDYVKLLKL